MGRSKSSNGGSRFDKLETWELLRWLRRLKNQPLRDAETEAYIADEIGAIEDEIAARRSNRLDAVHVQGQRR